MIKIIWMDTVTHGFYQQLNNSYYSTLYITAILWVCVIYNIHNHTLLLYSLSHLPFQNLSLSGGLVTAPDWLLVTTLLKVSGTLLSV